MHADFWHDLWDKNNTGWHNDHVNELLLKSFPKLKIKANSRVFIPLCGKTLDIKYMLDNGHKVVGVELNEKAVKELFKSLELEPTIKSRGSFIVYSAKNVVIFVGDIFELDRSTLGGVDVVYDRGATVALPLEMRKKYAAMLVEITNISPHLTICYDYDQDLKQGPPFSVKEEKLKEYYDDFYTLELVESIKPKGHTQLDISENVWLLQPRSSELTYKKVESENDIDTLLPMAYEIWTNHFGTLFESEVVSKLVQAAQSKDTILSQIAEGYEYFFIQNRGIKVGYFAYKIDKKNNELFLGKLYIYEKSRGQGVGREVLEHLEKLSPSIGVEKIVLTVYYKNFDSIKAYEKWGFKNLGIIRREFGDELVFQDVKMEKKL